VVSDGAITDAEREVHAGLRHLADSGCIGLAWVGPDLVVASRHGTLAGFIALGRPLTETVLVLSGAEARIRALAAAGAGGAPLTLADVSMQIGPDAVSPKLDISISWVAERRQFLVVLARIADRSEQQAELAREVRRRQMVEGALAARSRELEQLNGELLRANRDLSEFAYIISHDLNAPLRLLRRSVGELEREAEERSAAREAIAAVAGDIRRQANRMSEMLTGLLAYSEAGRKESAVETVDSGALVAGIIASLPLPERFHVEVTGEWPVIDTLIAPLDLVLRNLIENALKHHDRLEGVVRIDGRMGERLEIAIMDDGPGVPIGAQQAVFQPFVRLRPEGVPGSGIGLSIVRKTVETGGGTIRLVSDPAVRRGTTFLVEWPARRAG
jgi:signal transduction histidine kinase